MIHLSALGTPELLLEGSEDKTCDTINTVRKPLSFRSLIVARRTGTYIDRRESREEVILREIHSAWYRTFTRF